MNDAFLHYVILAASVYRLARFIIMDSIWDDTRDKFLNWLTTGEDAFGERHPIDNRVDPEHWRKLNFLKRKVAELMGCPWCVTIWVAGAVIAADYFLPVEPFFYFLALSTGGLVFWAIIDNE